MPLENAMTIAQLDSTWPLGLDSSSRGDDHLRLLKAVLKAQFPGADGHGYSKPITVTEDELNTLPQKVADLGKTLFPVGSVVMRMDAVNPATLYGGTWQLITGDATITFGNGAKQTGTVTGSNDVSVPLPAHTHDTTHNLGTTTNGKHNHAIRTGSQRMSIHDTRGNWFQDTNMLNYTEYSGDHNHDITGGVAVQSAGTANARINVAGARIAINIWRRTAL